MSIDPLKTIELLAQKETQEREMEDATQPHARAIKEPEVLRVAREREEAQISLDRSKTPLVVDSAEDIPPSLYWEMNGITPLLKEFNLQHDTPESVEITNFIIEKMRIGHLEDTQENFNKVLDNLLRHNNLSRGNQKSYIMKRLHLYLQGNSLEPEDNLVLSITKKGRIKLHGKFI